MRYANRDNQGCMVDDRLKQEFLVAYKLNYTLTNTNNYMVYNT